MATAFRRSCRLSGITETCARPLLPATASAQAHVSPMPTIPAIARPVVFPLFGIVDGRCACGRENCPLIGKHPASLWRDVEYGSPVGRPEPGAGCAIRTGAHPKGSDVFVVDLDGPEAALLFDGMGPCPETYAVESPRVGGGWHLYFRHPGFPVKSSSGRLGPHIDIRGEGGIIVAPGSPHKSGGTYAVCDDAPIADAPEWLLAWLQSVATSADVQVHLGDVTGPEDLTRHRGLYAEYLRIDAPARGPALRGRGDQTLFEVVQRGAYDLRLPVADVLELVREHYDPRCDPPWADDLEERVIHKANDAKENSTRPRAVPLPSGCFPGVDLQPDDRSVPPSSALGITWGQWDKPIEPPVYLLEDLIPEHKVVTFYAAGGSVKSWCAFQLAISVATGAPWLGKAVRRGRALILDYEDGRYEFQRRMRILRGGILEDIPELGYLYGGPQLTDRSGLWSELVRMQGAPETALTLLVIDTLGSGMPPDADENTTAFAEAVKLAGRFTEARCTVVILAHANKTGGLRGSTAIWDSSDVAFRFEPISETDDVKRMRMVCDKPGPQKKPTPVNIELSDEGLRTFEDEGADLARNDESPEALDAAILLTLEGGDMGGHELARHLQKRPTDVLKSLRVLQGKELIHRPSGRALCTLDNDGKRRTRVLLAAATSTSTAQGLAREAGVSLETVGRLVEAGHLAMRSPGRACLGWVVSQS